MEVARALDGYEYVPPPIQGNGEVAPAPPPEVKTEVRPPERKVADDTLQRAVDEINSSVSIYRRHLGVRHHEASNRRIVTVYDSDTNEAIREIPPEKVLDAYASMLEMVGIFMDKRG